MDTLTQLGPVRSAAASALADIGPAAVAAVPALNAIVADDRPGIEHRVNEWLKKITSGIDPGEASGVPTFFPASSR